MVKKSVLAVLLFAGLLTASYYPKEIVNVGAMYIQNGYLWIDSEKVQPEFMGNINGHPVYFVNDPILIQTQTPAGIKTTQAFGLYTPRHDGSPGFITLVKGSWEGMARTLAHELCHAQQDEENRPFDETECNRVG